MSLKEKFYPETKFGGFTDIDGTVAFYSRVNSLLVPSHVILDVGCGRGVYGRDRVPFRRNLRILKGKVARVIGIDVDPNAGGNPFLDEFRLIRDQRWPVEDDSIDLIVSDSVLEHVENPDRFFLEARRVLKDGGYFCIRTPNRWNYIALAATLIPNKYHWQVISSARKDESAREDVFPTVYRCNSIGKLRRALKKSGFGVLAVYGHEAEPKYLSFSSIAYFLGVLHQRLAPGFFKTAIFAFGIIKKDAGY